MIESLKTVFIRADGNESIASGHIMRCMSVARQIRRLGGKVRFVLADDGPVALLEREGFSYHVLHTKWNDLDAETEILISYLIAENAKTLLVDSYSATEYYLQRLGKVCSVIYMDDYADKALPVQALVHYCAFDSLAEKDRMRDMNQSGTELLVGSLFIPLREEFSEGEYSVRDTVRSVMITTGGADQLRMAEGLIDALLNDEMLKELQITVIVGIFNQSLPVLKDIMEQRENITVLTGVTDMAVRMRSSDVVFSAAGTTLFELAACGIPTICFEVADNQRGAERWEKEGCMLYAGNAAEDREKCIRTGVEKLKCYIADTELRIRSSKNLKGLIDGKGAERIADYLLKI